MIERRLFDMDTKNILYELRMKHGLTQDDLAQKIFVTRQAVSRWENGETAPNTETLKLLSKLFQVSINTLLGSPHKLICQCCGMPLDDAIIGKDQDGAPNENYCQWCYADGHYIYNNINDLIDVCVDHMKMTDQNFSEKQARDYLQKTLPNLDYWKRYRELGGDGQFEEFKNKLIQEINNLRIDGMPEVKKLNALVGKYINLEYRLPNGTKIKFLDDNITYLGAQLESLFDSEVYFGVLANMDFILIATYAKNSEKDGEKAGKNPELILYKKR